MNPNELNEQRIVKLIAFSIGKRSFTAADAMNATGMGLSELLAVGKRIYTNGEDISHDMPIHQVLDWHLSPEALFSYMSLKEFEHSVKAAADAKKLAMISIAISGLLAIGSIIASIAG